MHILAAGAGGAIMSGRGYRKSPSFLISITESKPAERRGMTQRCYSDVVRALSDVVHFVEKCLSAFSCFVKTSEI